MIGILIVTHFDLGKKLLEVAESMMGKQQFCASVSIDLNQDSAALVSKIREALEEVDLGEGVLILTDMFGGSPTNLSLSLLGEKDIEVVTGVNLPMILGILSSRELPLKELAAKAKSYGRQGITVASEILERKIPIK